MNRLFLALVLALAACAPAPKQVHRFQKPLMHTQWDFSLVASSEADARQAVDSASAEIERLDKSLAMWRPESELHGVNAKAGGPPQKISDSLAKTIALGLQAGGRSGGAFDISIAPLVQLWYHGLQQGRVPADFKIAAARSKVDYRRVSLNQGKLSLPQGMSLDLGGLAKGYAQDRAAALFRAAGIKDFLMNAGGQVYASGRKPDGKKWKVGVLNPRAEGKVVAVIELENQCMSTSGDYEQFTLIRGRRYHHILDPRTGRPTAQGVASATVILGAADFPNPGGQADTLSTSVFVLGPGKGKALAEGLGVSSILIMDGEGKLSHELSRDLLGKLELEF